MRPTALKAPSTPASVDALNDEIIAHINAALF